MFVREKCQSVLFWHSELGIRPRANGAPSGFNSGQQPGERLQESLSRQNTHKSGSFISAKEFR